MKYIIFFFLIVFVIFFLSISKQLVIIPQENIPVYKDIEFNDKMYLLQKGKEYTVYGCKDTKSDITPIVNIKGNEGYVGIGDREFIEKRFPFFSFRFPLISSCP